MARQQQLDINYSKERALPFPVKKRGGGARQISCFPVWEGKKYPSSAKIIGFPRQASQASDKFSACQIIYIFSLPKTFARPFIWQIKKRERNRIFPARPRIPIARTWAWKKRVLFSFLYFLLGKVRWVCWRANSIVGRWLPPSLGPIPPGSMWN